MPESEQPKSEPAGTPVIPGEERQKLFARRALIQAGWVIPAVTIFSVPGKSAGFSNHFDGGHEDLGFSDAGFPHGDTHTDLPLHTDGLQPFNDSLPHGDGVPHIDMQPGHNDSAHNDQNPIHGDTVHNDSVPVPHLDSFHGDVDPGAPHSDNFHFDNGPGGHSDL